MMSATSFLVRYLPDASTNRGPGGNACRAERYLVIALTGQVEVPVAAIIMVCG